MVKQNKVTLRTRHINCFYCIAISFFILAIVLFALSSKQTEVLGNDQNHTSVIIGASILLLLSLVIFVSITYYAIRYFRAKKENQKQLNYLKKPENRNPPATTSKTPVVVINNAAFKMDDRVSIGSAKRIQTFA
ncbi:unnamed protein product [Adineta steineri]|uniref:Uncharacterized protein n=1 Tax=Adineta steineri TaxID=433720 RepID=A0A813VXS6_9BILA|nr:unnamed protein product [Adineta steineri]CAF3667013.1 unnamed protein product [Adineta steineri]